jgi:hypothetical protein
LTGAPVSVSPRATEIIRRRLKRPDRLRELARELDTEAYRLRQEAEELESRHEFEERVERRRRIIREAANDLGRGGIPKDTIIAGLAARLEIEIGSAKLLLADEVQSYRRAAKGMRNRHIMRLARRGWTNDELGEKFDLHPKHISRIVQRLIRSQSPMGEELR